GRGRRTRPLSGLSGGTLARQPRRRPLLQRPHHEDQRRDMTPEDALALVTGGAGFIGSHLVDLLLTRGYRVRVIDNLVGGREDNLAAHAADPCLEVVWRDVRQLEPDDPLFGDVQMVFHLAG